MKRTTLLTCVALLSAMTLQARTGVDKMEYSVSAGFNIGGSAPLGLPAEIRHIDSYSPTLNLSIGAQAACMFTPAWGVGAGLYLETKGMHSGIEARNYHLTMNIIQGESTGVKTGYFTGKIKNETKISYLTIPIFAQWRPSVNWTFHAGPYISVALDRSFIGQVAEGKMREDPLHPALGILKADYNYSDDIRKIDTGISLGAACRVYRALSVKAALQWGLLSTLDPSKRKIDMDTYNIYLNLGISYTFH